MPLDYDLSAIEYGYALMNEEWRHLRAKLHHDWLMNRYMTFLQAEMEVLNHPVGEIATRENVREQLLGWRRKRATLNKFIETTIDALSPRQLLLISPLNQLEKEDKEWLGALIHDLYLEKSGIEGPIAELRKIFLQTDELVTAISAMLALERDITIGLGDLLLNKIKVFSRLISELPYDVQISLVD